MGPSRSSASPGRRPPGTPSRMGCSPAKKGTSMLAKRCAHATLPIVATILAGILAAPLTGHAATIEIINSNGPDVGFNDATEVAPVGGNAGTTLGEQRLIAFQRAAAIWGATLTSPVPIRIQAQMVPLPCT